MAKLILQSGTDISHKGNVTCEVLNMTQKEAIALYNKLETSYNIGYKSLTTYDGQLLKEFNSALGGEQSKLLCSIGGREFTGETRAEVIKEIKDFLNDNDACLSDLQIEREFLFFNGLHRSPIETLHFFHTLEKALPANKFCKPEMLDGLVSKLQLQQKRFHMDGN